MLEGTRGGALACGGAAVAPIPREQQLSADRCGWEEGRGGATAIVQVLSGRLRFTVDAEDLDAGAGYWLYMAPGTPHALVASEPTVMLLTLVTGGRG